jgi:aspartate aminotransferase
VAGTRIGSSNEFASFLLEAARIAVVPGIEFGSDAHIRLSYACSMEHIEQGMARMAAAVATLQ